MTMPADPAASLQGILLFLLLFAVSAWDIRCRKIPDFLQAGIAALALLDFSPDHLAGILCMIPYLAVALFSRKKEGIGGGDVKLAGSTGLVLGLPAALTASVAGLSCFILFGAVISLGKQAGKKETRSPFPVGPFLAAGCMCGYVMKMKGLIV